MAITTKQKNSVKEIERYKYNFKTSGKSTKYKSPKGLNEDVVREISRQKREPSWMLDIRLKAYKVFLERKMPSFGGDLSGLNFDDIHYYIKPDEKSSSSWNDVPEEIKDTFDKLGIPEAERKFLAGVGAQFESEVVYHKLQKDLEDKGIIFKSTDQALIDHPDLFKEYFGTVIPAVDNKFAALNTAVWSGGSFIYVPKGVHLDLPLQAYFRINAERMGQFERTLIIADEGSSIHYIEGCTAPAYSSKSLHSAVVEIIVKKGASMQYTTIQNWASNIYNLVTKRAMAFKDAEMIWLDCNIGSKVTMKYPSVYLREEGAKGEVYSLAFAGKEQHQDAGAKIVHMANNTSSNIISKSISKDSGRSSYRGLIKVMKGAEDISSKVVCDALMLDSDSRSDTYPIIQSDEENVAIAHEATVAKISEENLFYLMSRGLSEEEANSMIVNGFARDIVKSLPMEYALELNRILELEMTGSIG